MSANECIEALESDLAQYVIDRKVDESMQRYLKTRVYPIASILGTLLLLVGISLGTLFENYRKLQTLAVDSKAVADKARDDLTQISGEVATIRNSWDDARQDVDKELLRAKTTLDVQRTLLEQNYHLQTAATTRAAQIAASTENALKQTEASVTAAAQYASDASKEANQAKTDAAAAAVSKQTIEDARTAAIDYQNEVATQKRVLGLTVIDFALLARNISSTVTLQNPHDDSRPIVLTLTPQSVTMKGFTIDVRRDGLPEDPLVVNKTTFGKWQPLPATRGLYRYMVDFVYEQRGVRNFVVMRFGGSPDLFDPPKKTVSR